MAVPAARATDKYAGEFLKIPVGARALGMGSAFTALADDPTAVYWNPAGLIFGSKRQAWAEHAEQFGDLVNHDFLAYGQPLEATSGGALQAIGFGFLRSAVDDIVIRDKDPEDLIPDVEFEDTNGNGEWDFDPNDPDGPGSERLIIENIPFFLDSESEWALLLSYARTIGQTLAIGGTAKIIRQSLPGNSSFGIGADLGMIYFPTQTLSAAVRVTDVTTTLLSWESGNREFIAPAVTHGPRCRFPRWPRILVRARAGPARGGHDQRDHRRRRVPLPRLRRRLCLCRRSSGARFHSPDRRLGELLGARDQALADGETRR
jgi:hypothetical protein